MNISYMLIPAIAKTDVRKIDAEGIMEKIFQHQNIDPYLVKRRVRKYTLVHTRQLCFYFIKKHTNLTYCEIGKLLSAKKPYDHTTVIHGIRHLKDLIDTDEKVREEVYTIENILNKQST